jgi:hypothetical protein
MSMEEVDRLSMDAIDKITARSPVKDYRTQTRGDGTSSHVIVFWNGGRFVVFYDGEDVPIDFQAEGVRFEAFGETISVMADSA